MVVCTVFFYICVKYELIWTKFSNQTWISDFIFKKWFGCSTVECSAVQYRLVQFIAVLYSFMAVLVSQEGIRWQPGCLPKQTEQGTVYSVCYLPYKSQLFIVYRVYSLPQKSELFTAYIAYCLHQLTEICTVNSLNSFPYNSELCTVYIAYGFLQLNYVQ